jgi:hypothetical protein
MSCAQHVQNVIFRTFNLQKHKLRAGERGQTRDAAYSTRAAPRIQYFARLFNVIRSRSTARAPRREQLVLPC